MVPVTKTSGQESGRQSTFSRVIGEECLVLLDRLGLAHADQPPVAHALGLTSCLSAEGVTTIAAQTAVAAATHLRLRTVLVDCHFAARACTAHLVSVFAPACEMLWKRKCRSADVLRPSGVELLSLVTAGTVQKDTAAAWFRLTWPGSWRSCGRNSSWCSSICRHSIKAAKCGLERFWTESFWWSKPNESDGKSPSGRRPLSNQPVSICWVPFSTSGDNIFLAGWDRRWKSDTGSLIDPVIRDDFRTTESHPFFTQIHEETAYVSQHLVLLL